MNLNTLKAQVALGEDSRRQCKQDLPNNLTVAKIRIGPDKSGHWEVIE